MKRLVIYSFFGALLALVSCQEAPVVQEFPRPVKVMTVEDLSSITKEFAGVVESYNNSYLTFRVGGTINKLNVVEGSRVKTGEIIAELDTRDIVLELNAREIAFATAKSQLERNERLLAKEAVSTQDYEISKAQYTKAEAEYNYSKNQLYDAKLRAPFSGFIEKRYVENYQKVQAGEQIVKLVDPASLEIRFTIPDSYIPILKNKPKFSVEFERNAGVWYEATMKEYIESSTGATGIPVKLAITDPRFNNNTLNISTGFSCKIKLTIPIDDAYLSVPSSAVFKDEKTGKTSVWLYENGKATSQPVVLGVPVDAGNLMVDSGLKVRDIIIISGAQYIYEGEKVTLLK